MLRFAKVNKSSRKIILWCKKSKVWDVEVGDIVISKLIERKNNSKCLIKYLDEVIRPIVLILPKMSRYVKTFKDKNENLMSYHTDNDDKLLENTSFYGLYVLKGSVKCKSFTIISIGTFLVFKDKYYLQVYLNNCMYKIVNTKMIDHLDDNLFDPDKNQSYKYYITIQLI